jgi:hypothetical protein
MNSVIDVLEAHSAHIFRVEDRDSVCLQNFGNIAHFQEVKIFHSKALVVNERP